MYPGSQRARLLIGGLFGALVLIALEIQAFIAAQRCVEQMADTTDAHLPARSRRMRSSLACLGNDRLIVPGV